LNLPLLLDPPILANGFQEKGMDKVIRILVANRPRLMRELLLATLADRPDIEIVGEVSNEAEIPASVKRTAPDLLVISLDDLGQRPRICDTVLRAHPDVRIIAVATEHNRSVCYWASLQLDIHSSDIEPSEEGILSVMRNIAEGVGGQA
jgi:DNA-binding NarL/FixJ family response regulator